MRAFCIIIGLLICQINWFIVLFFILLPLFDSYLFVHIISIFWCYILVDYLRIILFEVLLYIYIGILRFNVAKPLKSCHHTWKKDAVYWRILFLIKCAEKCIKIVFLIWIVLQINCLWTELLIIFVDVFVFGILNNF